MMKRLFLSAVFGALLAGQASADEYDNYRKCLFRVNEEDLAAKMEFQTALADLIIEDHPTLGNLAILNRDFQISIERLRSQRLDYLIENQVIRIVSASGLVRFINFDWEQTDEDKLLDVDPNYKAASDQIQLLAEENNNHQSWPELREQFVSLQQGGAFQKIMKDFQKAQERTEKRLEGC